MGEFWMVTPSIRTCLQWSKTTRRGRGWDAHDSGVFDGARLLPPAFAIPIDGAFSGDGHVFSVGGADQSLNAGKAKLGDLRIVSVIGRAEQRRAFIELESDVALEDDRSAEIRASGELNGAAAFGRAGIDGFLNRVRVLGGSIGFGAEVAGIAGAGRRGAGGEAAAMKRETARDEKESELSFPVHGVDLGRGE